MGFGLFLFLLATIVVASGVGVIIYRRRWGGVNRGQLRALRAACRYRIRDFPEGGHGRIVGVVAGAPVTLVAPLSGRVCVAFAFKIHEYDAVMKRWELVVDESEGVLFWLADDSARATVHAHVATLMLKIDRSERAGILNAPSAALKNLLHAHGVATDGAVFRKTLRCEEGVILPGQRVSVAGTGHRVPDPGSGVAAAGYREPAALLCIDDGPHGEILVSNVEDAQEV